MAKRELLTNPIAAIAAASFFVLIGKVVWMTKLLRQKRYSGKRD